MWPEVVEIDVPWEWDDTRTNVQDGILKNIKKEETHEPDESL